MSEESKWGWTTGVSVLAFFGLLAVIGSGNVRAIKDDTRRFAREEVARAVAESEARLRGELEAGLATYRPVIIPEPQPDPLPERRKWTKPRDWKFQPVR